jgi:DnaK suppressor protein
MEIDKVRQELLAERARLEREVQGFEDEFSVSFEEATDESSYDQHPADSATAYVDREIDLSLEGNARSIVNQIDRALQKLDQGTYGICDNCGRLIGEGRLEVEPYAALCIDCRRLLEREERGARLNERRSRE